jgi:glycosyltransferase involved in cell wall biosynthesis
LRIALDISPVIYPQYGAGRYLRELSRRLILDYPEDEFVLLAYSLRARAVLIDYLAQLKRANGRFSEKIYPLPVSLFEWLWNRLHLVSVEKLVGRVDLFHASDWVQPPSAMPCLTTVHDLSPWLWPDTFPRKIIVNQKRRLEHVRRQCRLVLADSEATKNDLMEILGFSEERIRVVYLGVDHERFRPDVGADEVAAVLEKYRLSTPYLLSVGTRNPRKNLKRLLAAFRLVRARPGGQGFSLVLAGRFGWGGEISPQPGVKLAGFVDSADLPALYAGAAALVYPSLYEGFGLPLLEAMACGTPVVTSRSGSLAEVGGEAAIYVDPLRVEEIAGGMEKVIGSSEAARKKRRRESLLQAQKFSWEKCARETHAVYRELAASDSLPGRE